MNILFTGDSYAAGRELKDETGTRFSKLVCDHFNANEINLAVSGTGNEYILMKTFENITDVDFAVIQLSYSKRIVVAGDITDKFVALNPISRLTDFRTTLARAIHQLSAKNALDWYRLTRYKVLMLDSYLTSKNIPHIFFVNGHDVEFYRNDKTLPDSFLQNFISISMDEVAKQNNFPIGMKFHPLEETHKYFTENYLIPEIQKKLNNISIV